MPFLLDYTYTYLLLEKFLETGSVFTCPRVRAEEVILECLQHFFFCLLTQGKASVKARQSLSRKGRRLFRDQ